jgi:hypothetical protein
MGSADDTTPRGPEATTDRVTVAVPAGRRRPLPDAEDR